MIEEKKVYYSIIKKDNIKVEKTNKKLETKQAIAVLNKMMNFLDLEMKEIYFEKFGKPYFKDSKIFFNYSHSKNYIACAISLSEVGIDIEERDRIIADNIANKCLDGEKNNDKRIETWVKKEAYSKLKGLGLTIDFKTIKLEEIPNTNILIKDKNYICAIYQEEKDIEFKELKFNDEMKK